MDDCCGDKVVKEGKINDFERLSISLVVGGGVNAAVVVNDWDSVILDDGCTMDEDVAGDDNDDDDDDDDDDVCSVFNAWLTRFDVHEYGWSSSMDNGDDVARWLDGQYLPPVDDGDESDMGLCT